MIYMKILIIEDEKLLADSVKMLLERKGFEVECVYDGKTGEQYAELGVYDLLILDVMMPEMDGYQVAREVRSKRCATPILMLTAKSDLEDRITGLNAGADYYLTKPFDKKEMLLRIKALLRRSRIVSERRIDIGDVTLRYDDFTVTRNGETQELPQKEFLLLYKLLSWPGKTFTRIQLMDEIWGADSDTGWETVTVHIGRLRRRFEGWEEFSIESVRGLGYKAVKKV